MSGQQSYMGGGMGSANMTPPGQGMTSTYNALGLYNPNGTGSSNPTWGSNPLWGGAGGGMGGGSPYGGMDMRALYDWIGSMYNPQNMLYNQGVTDKATQSTKGGVPFSGYPPPVPPTGPGGASPATAAVGMGPVGATQPGQPFQGGPGQIVQRSPNWIDPAYEAYAKKSIAATRDLVNRGGY